MSEAIFKRLKGIKSVLPGYSGGIVKNPSYDQVCTEKTGHAESIQIEFDPKVIPFEKILDIFWHTHNPTTLNRQGNDIGTHTHLQSFIMTKNKKSLQRNQKKSLKKKVYTKILLSQKLTPLKTFTLQKIITKITMKNIKTLGTVFLLLIPKCTSCFVSMGMT